MNKTSFKDGDNVIFGRCSIGVFRGYNEQNMAIVHIGFDYNTNQPIVALVPDEELTLDN